MDGECDSGDLFMDDVLDDLNDRKNEEIDFIWFFADDESRDRSMSYIKSIIEVLSSPLNFSPDLDIEAVLITDDDEGIYDDDKELLDRLEAFGVDIPCPAVKISGEFGDLLEVYYMTRAISSICDKFNGLVESRIMDFCMTEVGGSQCSRDEIDSNSIIYA